MIFLLLRSDCVYIGNIMVATITWLPVINPILTIYIIGPYRSYFYKNWFKNVKHNVTISEGQQPTETNNP